MILCTLRSVLPTAVALSFVIIAHAADKSGVSPNTISLPKGPGSIEGLGESFQPTLNTGTAKYALKLNVPSGTVGHAPMLALQYEGGGGNGPLGFGWTLPNAYIQRRTDRGIPTYGQQVGVSRNDSFINDAKEELVPLADGFFFCKNESTFIRYRQAGDHWEATAPNGTRMEFGLTAQGRVQNGPDQVFGWMLERETDTRGNTIVYAYTSFPGESNANQVYLAAVRYGPGAPPWSNFNFIIFEYEDRPDWFEDCRAGFSVRTGKRLKSIIVGTQGPTLANHLQGDFDGDGLADSLVRRYELEYLQYAGAQSHWSLLGKVIQVGADGVSTLPPATFNYRVCDPSSEISAAGRVIPSVNTPEFIMDNPLAELVDVNGDGLPDILKTEVGDGSHTAYLNSGMRLTNGVRSILWKPGIPMSSDGDAVTFNLQSDETTGTHGSHLADMNGDGAADFVVKAGPESVFYFANSNALGWGARRQMAIQDFPPPAPFGSPGVRTADLDFDKRIDIIRSLGGDLGYHIWFNTGDQSYSSRILAESSTGFSFDFDTPAVQIADLNGDRVPDIAWVRPSSVIVTAGLGYGRFAAPVSIPLPGAVPLTEQQINRATLTDLTGDGLADLVIERAEGSDLWYWINLGTYYLGERKRITGIPVPVGGSAVVRWADLNGNGTIDYVLADHESDPAIQTVDLGELIGCGSSPNVLTAISNGIGRVTLIDYETSTTFRLADAAADQPWPNPTPFPVPVVSAVTNLDSLGHAYATQFRYHDGYYDATEKQFRGFARVEQVDLGDVTAPTLVTRSVFNTGKTNEVMKGKLIRLTTEQEDGLAFSDESTAWTLPPLTLYTGTNGVAVHYAHPVSRTNILKELGQGAERRLESEMDFDRYGNQTSQADYGIVEGGGRSAFNDERVTTTEYAINTNAWILRLPARQETKDESGTVISRAEFFYDDEAFSGNSWGLVTIGNLTMKREWKDPANPAAYITSARTKFDAYGNPTTILDPLASAPGGTLNTNQGHGRKIAYDPRFYTYPVTETIHLGEGKEPLVFRASYDEGFGTVTSSTDFNSNRTDYNYDSFARLTSIMKPGDAPEYPTVEYGYALAVPVSGTNLVNFVETRQLDKVPGTAGTKRNHYFLSRQFVDGLGRKLMTKTEAEPASNSTAPRVVVTEASQFNARQKPARVLNPFYSLQGASIDELLVFENIERPGWQGQFNNDGSLVTLDLVSAHTMRTDYDATLRPTQVTNPDDSFRRTIYEPLLTRSFDENDVDPASENFETPMVHYNDGLGRLVQVDETTKLNDNGTPSGTLQTWTTRYEYDLNDQLTRITDSQNNVKTFAYDGLKRKIDMNDPDRGVMHFIYDDASNLIETTDAKNQRISYTYDGANRICTEKYHDGQSVPPWRSSGEGLTNSVVYHYDTPFPNLPQGDNTLATAHKVKGALAWVEDLSGEEHTSYDSRGRVKSVVKRIPDPLFYSHSASGGEGPGKVALVSYATRFAYDSVDRLTNLIYPDADQLRYEYNDRNLLQRIPGGPSGSIIAGIAYQPSAQMGQIDYGNGVRTTYAYDSRLRLKSLLTVSQPATLNQQLINFGYDFDGVSNIKSITDRRPDTAVPANDPRRNTQVFGYDDLYRLTQVGYVFAVPPPSPPAGWAESQTEAGYINYRYDRIGNMLAQRSSFTNHLEKGLPVANLGDMESGGGTAGRSGRGGRSTGDPPGPHALTRISNPESQFPDRLYGYDANGNMTNIDGLVCTWDFKDRLVAVENNEMRAVYSYDYTDRRISKSVSWKPGAPDPDNLQSAIRNPQFRSTLYINKYFEIREHDAPTKYVWNGNTRVARVIGSLNTNVRVQRLRLWPGWNLCSLAVSSTSPLWGEGRGEVISAAFCWNSAITNWEVVPANTALPAGTVLWLKASTNATLTVTGTYSNPTDRTVSPGGDFLPSAGLEAWDFKSAISNLTSATAWIYDAPFTRWVSWLPPPLELQSDLPAFIAPGQAVFARTDVPAQLEVPDSALRIRFYHQDHLRSSSLMSDVQGSQAEQTTFYPFGHPRSDFRPRNLKECYGFTQKEQDAESSLQYFEVRFMSGMHGRFVQLDPLSLDLPSAWLGQPQRLNFYAYGLNNPLAYTDPSGRCAINDDGTVDCVSPAQNASAQVWNETAQAWKEGSYGTAAVGALLYTANSVNVAAGYAAQMTLAGPYNSGHDVASGFMEGDYDKALRGSLNLLALGVAGKMSAASSAPSGPAATQWNPLNGPGPLGPKLAGTFRSGTYTELVTQEQTTLYRAYGGNSGATGGFWTRTPPTGPLQSTIDSALNPAWGNTANNIAKIQVPAGTTIFEGAAAPQGGLVGGGNQIFIQKVDPKWLIK